MGLAIGIALSYVWCGVSASPSARSFCRVRAAAAGDKPDASGYDTTHSAVSGLESYFTNQQLYEALDPLNDNLPYMYASFNWQHCDEEGQSIQQFWKPRA